MTLAQRIPSHIPALLDRLKAENALRVLPSTGQEAASLVDFTSNDYLGLARKVTGNENGGGATGSRLLSGNHAAHEALERYCAELFQGESALLFNSGYLANLGVLSCLPKRGDTLLYDERSHASIKDGLRLSPAKRFSFRHNDLADLERLLQRAGGTVWIVVEALYSMDGDHADLPAMVELAERHGAYLVVDEAHSTGLYGAGGAGLACREGLQSEVLLRVHTFGKAVGLHGAVVVAPEEVKQYLVNRSRPFVYTTALPAGACRRLEGQLREMVGADGKREQLAELSARFRKALGLPDAGLWSPIVPWLCPGNAEVRDLAARVRAAGFDVRPILSPTVPAGEERLRIVLHSFNSTSQVDDLASLLHL